MNAPLAPQVFSTRSFTALIRALTEEDDARIVSLERAAYDAAHTIARYERLRARWSGDGGTGMRSFLLKVLPPLTWSEAIRPTIPAPSEVMMIESDLSAALGPYLHDGAVAAGRRTELRPAWLLYDDLPLLDPDLVLDSDIIGRIAVLTAGFHAQHWNAESTVAARYPWLPRFADWVQAHCQFLDRLLSNQRPGPYGREALRYRPTLIKALRQFWQAASPTQQERLRGVLRDPSPVLDSILSGPQTVINGDWRWVQMGTWGEEIIVREWSYVQYGPAVWDLCTFLSASPELIDPAHFITRYLKALRRQVPGLTKVTERTINDTFNLVRVLDLMLSPNRWQLLEDYTEESAQAWLDTLMVLLDEVSG